jgi:hypothetical protein
MKTLLMRCHSLFSFRDLTKFVVDLSKHDVHVTHWNTERPIREGGMWCHRVAISFQCASPASIESRIARVLESSHAKGYISQIRRQEGRYMPSPYRLVTNCEGVIVVSIVDTFAAA